MNNAWDFEAIEGDGGFGVALSFSDAIAHERQDLVNASVEYLRTVPGVGRVEHEDRELVLIATSLSTAHLREVFGAWWATTSSGLAAWQSEMDDLARAVHQALKPLGYRKRKWAFNRQLGELVHVVELRHYFDDGGRHDVTVSGSIDFPSVHELAGAERPSFSSESIATFRSVFAAEAPLSDRAAVLSNVDLALAVLGAFTDAESVVNEVRSGRALSLVGRGRQEAGSAALVLVATGRAHEALPLMQVEFERRNPIARPHLLRLAETVGITGIVTGADPSLSVTDESVLKAWSAAVPAKAALLAERADGVLRSQGGWRKRGLSSGREGVEQASELLRSTPAALESPSSEQTVPSAYYGGGLEPAALQRLAAGERCALAEELAAFVAMSAVGDSRVPTWSIGPDKALVLKGREDWAALTDVYRIVHADLVHGSPATLVEVYERARRAVGSS